MALYKEGFSLSDILTMFFILPGLTSANPGIYLAILFYQPGEKIGQFFYPVGKKERCMPG